uniref:T9SS C-terminal target domain-containing protein n=1 Tax=Prevotella sp. GTC17253 TaxID=3236793 RepID=A0AB33ITK5_9BACT
MNKKVLTGCLGIMAVITLMSACSSENDGVDNKKEQPTTAYQWSKDGGLKACNQILFNNGKEAPDGTDIGNGDQEFVFTGKQTIKKGTYILKGWVYIANGAELTIEPGTVIKGDKNTKASLIVERGGKILAQGTATAPIVFTSAQAAGSRKPGDWGGIILCGKARNNQKEMQIEGGPRTKHGGETDSDNSGILSYVRIEFAGYPFQKDQEINGLTLASVGSGTKLDHIQVSHSNDDSYEWFGGTVNCKYLIAFKGWDDDFDTDNGYSGNVQFGLSVRDPKIADNSMSNSFESDNCADGATVSPWTTATFSNITIIGPKYGNPSFNNDKSYITGGQMNPNNGSALGKFQSAIQIRRNSRLNCFNSVAVGFPIGLLLDNQKGDTQGSATKGLLNLKNIWLAGMDITGSDANKLFDNVLVSGYDSNSKPVTDSKQKSFTATFFEKQEGNKVVQDPATLLLDTQYRPQASSPLPSAASFLDKMLASGFDKVDYVGAFRSNDNWTDGWTNFNPENTAY